MISKEKEKTNKQFMLLSALGILFVVDAHAWSPLGFMTNFFPYNSFFMPMFCFISGYFFDIKCTVFLKAYIIRKAKRLLLPYFISNFFYIIVVSALNDRGIILYGKQFSLYVLFVEPFVDGMSVEFTNPAWFVPVLFMVVVLYALIRKLFLHFWNNKIATVTFVVLGAFSIYVSRKGYNTLGMLPVLKTFFMIQFFQLGVIYHCEWEGYFRKVSKLTVFILTIVINTVLMYIYPEGIWFNDISTMSGFLTNNCFLPLITSVTGISFWLKVTELLVSVLGNNRIVNYISNSTYTIMFHHILFFNLYNLFLSVFPYTAEYFDMEVFRATAWYRFEPNPSMRVFYVLVGMAGPLLCKTGWQKIKNVVRKKE